LPSDTTILVVDDDIDISNLVKTFLEMDGLKVNMFNDPIMALDHFKSNPKENAIVISDIRMPGMNGLELVANIKGLEPDIKVIFMTAYDMDNFKKDLEKYEYEITDVFQKPFSMKLLCQTVKNYLTNAKNL
jgi:DNA-binding NtrC family response regulator